MITMHKNINNKKISEYKDQLEYKMKKNKE